jgi:carbon-monoxide dehydrogenase large subunit
MSADRVPDFTTRLVGASVRRIEDPRLVRGYGRYLDDIALPGMLHAAFARSAHAHAEIRAVDASAARRLDGVTAVLTGRDLEGRVAPLAPMLSGPGFASTAWPALAGSRARFASEPLAVVAAASPYRAADAAEAITVDWTPLPVVPDVDTALGVGAPALHAGISGNVLYERRHRQGDVDAIFARAPIVLSERFEHGRCSASPLEPRGLIAQWQGDALTVWAGTQAPQIYRAAIASAFALDLGRVRIIVPDTGGGFGQKMHVMPEDLAVIAVARTAGRPVKWVESRRENLAAASQAREGRIAVDVAADRSGAILALRARVVSDAGAYHVYPLTQALEPLGTCSILPGPYRVPAYEYELLAVATNKPPVGAYRGVGMPFAVFAMERVLDLLARRLGIDPAEIRRRNILIGDDYPYTSASGLVYDSGDLPEALARALALAGYGDLQAERDEAHRRGRRYGVGLCCYTEYTGMGSDTYRHRGMVNVPGPEAATVKMHADGGVSCALSFPSQGQGHPTTVAQIIADRLSVPLDRIAVSQPDTDSSPPGSGTFASRGAIVQFGTVERAATAVRRKILAIAAGLMEAAAEDLEMREGRIAVRGLPDRGATVGEIARLAYAPPLGGLPKGLDPGLEATQFFDPARTAFSSAVHVAAVEVDPETGRVALRRYVVVEDCGPVINPMIVAGQIHGAIAQGIGEALGERLVYDDNGQLLSGTLMDYPLPVASGVPSFIVGHVETPSPLTPGGLKGMGEGGTVGAPAAIANAVADALASSGAEIVALPIDPESLVRQCTRPAHDMSRDGHFAASRSEATIPGGLDER